MPKRTLVAILAILASPVAMADEPPLTEAEMVAALSGRTASEAGGPG